jgi:hypothetical protein
MVERLLSVALTVEQRRGRRLTVSLMIGRGFCGASVFALRLLAFLDMAIVRMVVLKGVVL